MKIQIIVKLCTDPTIPEDSFVLAITPEAFDQMHELASQTADTVPGWLIKQLSQSYRVRL